MFSEETTACRQALIFTVIQPHIQRTVVWFLVVRFPNSILEVGALGFVELVGDVAVDPGERAVSAVGLVDFSWGSFAVENGREQKQDGWGKLTRGRMGVSG